MSRNFDLLGDPIPENHGKPGANGHVATSENIRKVRNLLSSGVDKKDIAAELGVSLPTLTRHYFNSGRLSVRNARRKARAELRSKLMLRLEQQADKGNVSAMKALKTLLDEEDVRDAVDEANRAPVEKKPAPVSAGKKEQMRSDAAEAIAQDDLLNPDVIH